MATLQVDNFVAGQTNKKILNNERHHTTKNYSARDKTSDLETSTRGQDNNI